MAGTLPTFAVGSLVATVVSTGIAVAAWRRRDRPAAPQFALFALGVAGWCLTAVLVAIGVPGTRYVWTLDTVFAVALGVVWLAFVLAYTGRSEWLSHPITVVLWAVLVAVVASLVLPAGRFLPTSGTRTTVDGLTGLSASSPDLGALLLVSVLVLDLLAFVLLGAFFVGSRSPYRRQVGTIFGARLFGFGTGVAVYAGVVPYSGPTLVPAAYAVQGLVVGWALLRYDLPDVVPLTADTIVERMRDGVVVLDGDDRIVDYNRSLADLVGADASLIGRPAEDVLPGLTEAVAGGGRIRLAPENGGLDGSRARIYEPQRTPLSDHHDTARGQVIVLREVTHQRTRQRTLAAIQSATEAFLEASDPETVANVAVEATGPALPSPYAVVALADDDGLRPVALADEFVDEVRDAGLLRQRAVDEPLDRDGTLRAAFERGEAAVDDSLVLGSGDATVSVPTALVVPLGEHGVIAVGKPEADATFGGDELRTVETLARSMETALDRLARERELAQSRSALARRTRQLQFFNSALRHDLRNAVSVIDANLMFLSEHVSEAGHDQLRTISKWVTDVEALVDTVASITTAITDEDDRQLSGVPVSETLTDRIEKVSEGHDPLTITTRIPEGLTALGDELFGEVIENLLLNAVEHNDADEPRISVTAQHQGGTVEIRIADNGPGIPEEFRGEVFEPGVGSEDTGSVGFGLYFVKVMTEEYGGSVRFEANQPRGTVAVLTLPTPETTPADATETAAES